MISGVAIRLPFQPDELLSSWLVRLAMAQGCDPLVLTSYLWPRKRVWTTDLDRGTIGDPRAGFGLSAQDLTELTLIGVASRVVNADYEDTSAWPWVLAVGCRNRRRYGGLQFCPMCLATDIRPYYRRAWRLAWHTGCSKHDCALQDRCGTCGAVLEPHRLTLADKHIALCASCKADLRNQPAQPWDPMAARFQWSADEALTRGTGCYGITAVSIVEWFRLARFIIALLRAAGRPRHQRFGRLLSAMGVDQDYQSLPSSGLPLELLPTADRATLLSSARQILDVGPEALINAALSAGLTRSGLRSIGGEIPTSICSLISALPPGVKPYTRKLAVTRARPRSKIAVERMVLRLRRRARR